MSHPTCGECGFFGRGLDSEDRESILEGGQSLCYLFPPQSGGGRGSYRASVHSREPCCGFFYRRGEPQPLLTRLGLLFGSTQGDPD